MLQYTIETNKATYLVRYAPHCALVENQAIKFAVKKKRLILFDNEGDKYDLVFVLLEKP